ncbi:GGDEF domain-containing response regulator [Moritella viscosa]|uniref:diguanylate cyclase n=1 Tax=Moritella viscosa TaxID=80854 RepID=A0A090IHH2_9GAMM|nr:diguanylate cyclase [Moritella viscosa]CED60472.1 putative response regulator, GGDEF family protein [Moritella viscosa]SGY97502.1 GGDEF [Moritella viscosa]SGZ04098.1 GGDEF [Moritella viscosa]SGZ04467.1 GGDEF [Moritella viscosa]SGZ10887.1 GGDEF [Moritella viscosa]
MKILIIDDSKIERMIIRSYLQHLNHEVFDAKNGETGIALFSECNPDIVLLGVVMIGINGYQVAKQIRQEFTDWVPIIFLSGKTEPEDVMVGIEAGGDDYLPKPIQKQILIAKMTAMERIATMRSQLLKTKNDLELANEELGRLATLDGLTGIANRRHLDAMFSKELSRAKRHAQPLTFILADIDFFKKYNDHYGHVQGDECLKLVASTLNKSLRRPSELVARYGGEEFCMLLPNTDTKGAKLVAEKLVNVVRSLEIQHAGINEHAIITMSFGVVSVIPDRKITVKSLIQQADNKLYQAKKNGRDQWVI